MHRLLAFQAWATLLMVAVSAAILDVARVGRKSTEHPLVAAISLLVALALVAAYVLPRISQDKEYRGIRPEIATAH